MRRTQTAALLVLVGAFGLPSEARGQTEDGPLSVDLFQGPVLAPTRVASMGGAYAGYAEGIAGFIANAASPAVREPWSIRWFDQDIDASISVPLGLSSNDFDNSGDIDSDYTSFLYLSLGGQLQLGPAGLGFFGDLQRYTLHFEGVPESTFVTVGRFHVLGGWHFFGNQLAVGGGARIATLGVSAPDAELTFLGASPQVGLLLKPDWTPFRFGATYRHPVSAGGPLGGGGGELDARGVERVGALVLPDRVELPWQVEMGIALQVGPRPLNPEWIDPLDHEQELRDGYEQRARDRQRRIDEALAALPPGAARAGLEKQLAREERETSNREQLRFEHDFALLKEERRARANNWPRERLLLTLDLLVTGPVDDAISLERFLGQGQPVPAGNACLVVASGREVNFSPRFGLEMEPIKQWVHTRFGSYYEPPRFSYEPAACNDRTGRQHFTFGGDLKLLSTTWWGLVPEVTYKLQAYGDLAPRYQSFGGGIGVWH